MMSRREQAGTSEGNQTHQRPFLQAPSPRTHDGGKEKVQGRGARKSTDSGALDRRTEIWA